MDRTSCKTAAKSIPARRPRDRRTRRTPSERHQSRRRNREIRSRTERVPAAARMLRSRAIPLENRNESIEAVYFAAGRHHIADGGNFAGGLRRVPAIACFGVAASRLSDHTGTNVLSRRQPGCDGLVGYGAAGASVWPSAGSESNDLDELVRQLDYHAAVRSRSEH